MSFANGDVRILSSSSNEQEEPLKATYFCHSEDKKILDVVVELEGQSNSIDVNIPQRFILVIDVSGSMSGSVTLADPLSLLQRVQIFAKQFIHKTTEANHVSILVFSSDVLELLPMTRMSKNNKLIAIQVIESLLADGGTNISAGLLQGLNVAARSHERGHDCIILFTDGEANEGIVNPTTLIQEYKTQMQILKANGRINSVQLAAVTFDNYTPFFLSQIQQFINSDAFYVLNSKCDFEADMLIPLFLRQSACLSDITISLTCMEEVKFFFKHKELPGLKNIVGNTGLEFFFYSLPSSATKHIFVSLDISQQPREANILKVEKNYLDCDLRPRKSIDYIQLKMTSMIETSSTDFSNFRCTSQGISYFKDTYSYAILRGEVTFDLDNMLSTFTNVLRQRSRHEALSSIVESSQYVLKNDRHKAQRELNQCLEKIRDRKQNSEEILGTNSCYYRRISQNLNLYESNIEFGSKNIQHIPWARLMAMASSLETEMPTATGVFVPDISQPYMPPEIEAKIIATVEDINKEAGKPGNEYRLRLQEREEARQNLSDVLTKRDAKAIRTWLNICIEKGVDENTIVSAEALLDIVEKEDIMIDRIKALFLEQNTAELYNSVVKFRELDSKFVDKTGIVGKAETFLKDERKKNLLQSIETAKDSEKDEEMERLIEELNTIYLGEVIDESTIKNLKEHLQVLRIQIQLRAKAMQLMDQITKLIDEEDHIKLKGTLDALKSTTKTTHFKKNDDIALFYENSCKTLQVLEQKHDLRQLIKEIWVKSDVPSIPANLDKMKSFFSNIKDLETKAKKYTNVFTDKDDERLKNYEQEIANLEQNIEKRDGLEKKLRFVMEERKYNDIASALQEANQTLFVDEKLVEECKVLANYLHPAKRIKKLENAIKRRVADELEKEIYTFKDAGITSRNDLLENAERRLKKLRQIEKLNNLLKHAIEQKSIPVLYNALQRCDNSKTNKQDLTLYEDAKQLLDELSIAELAEILQTAIESRKLQTLDAALKTADLSIYKEEVIDLYNNAVELRTHLLEMEDLREAVMKMDNALLSEIKAYKIPPEIVFRVMQAVFLALGDSTENVDDWSKIQKSMKSTTKPLKKRIQRCNPSGIDSSKRVKIEQLISAFDVKTVHASSKGASTLYAWVRCMLTESSYLNP